MTGWPRLTRPAHVRLDHRAAQAAAPCSANLMERWPVAKLGEVDCQRGAVHTIEAFGVVVSARPYALYPAIVSRPEARLLARTTLTCGPGAHPSPVRDRAPLSRRRASRPDRGSRPDHLRWRSLCLALDRRREARRSVRGATPGRAYPQTTAGRSGSTATPKAAHAGWTPFGATSTSARSSTSRADGGPRNAALTRTSSAADPWPLSSGATLRL